jgi:uncharacterized membrane protein
MPVRSDEAGRRVDEPSAPLAVSAGAPADVEVVVTPPPRQAGPALSTWLAENGLAWIGGGALALGGALLVGYAASQGLFTPALRIWAALAVGSAMLGAGEWARRRERVSPARPGLVGALATGAGAATLYAAVWAAHALYGFIGAAFAGAGLSAVSAALLGLAMLHGEALALLAVAAALASPVVCGLEAWTLPALDGYLVVIVTTGLVLAGPRGWTRASLLTLAGAGAWCLARGWSHDAVGAGALIVATPAVALAAALRQPSSTPDSPWAANLVAVAVTGAWILWFLLPEFGRLGWAVHGLSPSPIPQSIVGVALALLTTVAVRLGRAPGLLFAGPAGALALAALAIAVDHAPAAPVAPWLFVSVAALLACALALALRAPEQGRTAAIAAAAAAAAASTALAAVLRTTGALGLGIDVGLAVLLGCGAAALARRSADPGRDLAVAAWIGACAEITALVIHAVLPGRPEPAAYGVLSIALALGARRPAWRGFAAAAPVAALASLASLLGPTVAGAAMVGHLAPWLIALTGGAGTAAQATAWRILAGGRAEDSAAAEAASTSAVVSGVVTAFLLLRRLSAPGDGSPAIGAFTSLSLETLLYLSAGLVLSARGGSGWLSRLRGPVFLAIGIAHGVWVQGLMANPLWGFGAMREPVWGPPLADAIALGFLGPALILGFAARGAGRMQAPAGVASGFFAVLWAGLEVRRLFHGADLTVGATGYAELAAYGVTVLALAVGARALSAKTRWSAAFGRSLDALTGAALALGVVLIAWADSPWWGPARGDLTTPILLFSLQGLAVVLCMVMARPTAAHASAPPLVARGALAGAVALAFVVLTLAIRFAFHGAAMRTPLREASVETWTFSAAWALFGLGLLVAAARRRDRALRWLALILLLGTTAKVFLFDMATLQGVVRAASFLALGALLLVGALVARRSRSAETS